jgi:hypothetical protein
MADDNVIPIGTPVTEKSPKLLATELLDDLDNALDTVEALRTGWSRFTSGSWRTSSR